MLVLAATPIGNLGDATVRLVDALRTATVVAAEDTRVTQRLLAGLKVENRPRLVSLNEHNERERIAELLAIAADTDVLVLSDAGMPTVSDPGYRLVTAAVEADVRVTVLPGASAVPTALAVSGLPTDRFAFEGFPPRRPAERRALLAELAREPRTLVFFESPQRLGDLLADLAGAFGAERRVAVCRELTKLHEEVVRGTAAELAAWAADGVRGEIVVVVEGAAPVEVSAEDAIAQVLALVASGTRLKEASAEVAEATGLSRRELYEAALRRR
ncbi:16S rRNA (cytidine(1402)-2'-O)-methyltransferase [Naasia sp. SYSU D00057]|uniref:16S rRNA (cytidine(1402)-2'-O)-methyltransferase n=1 Tax=Naasia sp. SYSU D00057 TaxID=2817380 RepID=UPI001B313854|nr:16S rRNA (cytidine(1402)-2'-O)-methyltransferase [Naasia sp. SYSU D00057]